MTQKNEWAKTPPMGWNSWDCYGASVNEAQLKQNADYMAKHLKQYGWEYVVCDIQWYEPTATDTRYHNFAPLAMDEYSRLIPAVSRFPSSAGGKGFRPIADYVHSLGLKFGIHIMRGIPRQAVHAGTPLLGVDNGITARDIAHPFSVCSWNTDMYGLNVREAAWGAERYYNSLFDLYASWGIDYVKVDDICVTEFKPHDLYSAKREIELIRKAIDQCGRPIVLSLSPGPAQRETAAHLAENANLWRMTGDFWDNWPQLYDMFERCETWQGVGGAGSWPDCDMLPLGTIEVFNRADGRTDKGPKGRHTNFTFDEARTMMTLWCIFRSPLMLGCELTCLDEETLSLITNEEILALATKAAFSFQVMRTNDTVIWQSSNVDEDGKRTGRRNVAFFNISNAEISPSVTLSQLWMAPGTYRVRDLWERKDVGRTDFRLCAKVVPHGAVCLSLTPES